MCLSVCVTHFYLSSVSGGVPQPQQQQQQHQQKQPEEEEMDLPSAGSERQAPSARHVPSPTIVETRRMRLAAQAQAQEKLTEDEYIILNLTLLEDYMTNLYSEHIDYCTNNNKVCLKPQIKLKKTSRIISVELKGSCKNCDFVGSPQKMYRLMPDTFKNLVNDTEEGTSSSKQGCRASSLNASLAGAVLNSMIGPTQMMQILLHIGVDCGSRTSLSKLMNNVGELKVKQAKESMARGVEKLKAQEQKCPGSTHISQDAMYNNRCRKGPFQAGTQMLYTTIGMTGNEKFAVNMGCLNKLCHSGKEIENLGLGSCKEGHENCTQTLDPASAIGQEGMMAEAALEELKDQGYIPTTMAVDGDDQIRSRVKQFSENHKCDIEIQYDPNHHFKNTQKHLTKTLPFTNDRNFPGRTKKLRQSAMNQLAIDIRNRCRAEMKKACKATLGSEDKDRPQEIAQLCTKASDAILDCLQGKCGTKCAENSLTCKGTGKSYRGQISLPVPLSKHNKIIAKSRIDTFFELKRVSDVYKFIDTNQNEAIHRGYQRTAPKLTTYSRNFEAKASSEIIHYNEGIAVSTELLNNAIGHKVCQAVKNKLEKLARDKEYNTRHSMKKETKKKRHLKLVDEYAMHRQVWNKRSGKGTYKKGVDLNPVTESESETD